MRSIILEYTSLERSTFSEAEWVQDPEFRPCHQEISSDPSTYVRSRRYEWAPRQRRRASSRLGFDRSHLNGHAIRTSCSSARLFSSSLTQSTQTQVLTTSTQLQSFHRYGTSVSHGKDVAFKNLESSERVPSHTFGTTDRTHDRSLFG